MRPARVHVQVDGDPVAVGERVLARGGRVVDERFRDEARVHVVELGRDDVEALPLLLARGPAIPSASRCAVVRDEAGDRRRRPRPRRRRPRPRARDAPRRRSRHEDRRLAEHAGALVGAPDGADMRAVSQRARDRGPVGERLRVQEVQLPVGEVAQRADQRARDRSSCDLELERDHAALPARTEEVGVHPDRDRSGSRPRTARPPRPSSPSRSRGARRPGCGAGRGATVASG